MWISDAFSVALAVPAVVFVLWILQQAWINRSPQAQLDHRYQQFSEQRRGVSFEAQQTELTMRYHAARLRRVASEAAIRSPETYTDALDAAIQTEVMQIAALDRQSGHAFAAWAKTAPLRDILYPVAMKAVYEHAKMVRKFGRVRAIDPVMRDDILASLKVR